MEQRTVEVINPRVPMFGTGCLVAPGVVLTAHHVACPGGDMQPVTVRDKAGRTAQAEVVWADAALDVVLLSADRSVLGTNLAVARWGELTCDYPPARPMCTMTGFPRAMRLALPDDPQTSVPDLKSVDGHIKPETGSRGGHYGFELSDASTGSAELWRGMSGAGAFCHDMLVGVATFASDHWQGGLLYVMPAARLFASPGFTDAVTSVTGMAPQLQPADLSVLFTDVPDPQLSSSYLLHARSAVVPMSGMTGQLDTLDAWCRTSRSTDITAVTGMGGIGKTRLMTELLHRLAQPRPEQPTARGWTGGFLADTPLQQPPPYGMLATSKYPLLIAVDYAETRRSQIDQVLDILAARRGGQPVRVLLLARGHNNWWPSLRRARQGTSVISTGTPVAIDPADALSDTSTECAFDDAKRAFTERIRALRNTGHEWATSPLTPDTQEDGAFTGAVKPDDEKVISLHMAALAEVLTTLNDSFARHENPMDVLIAHEMSYWRRIVEARGLFFDENLMRTLVSVQTVTGANKRADARAAVAAGFDVHYSGFPNTAPHDTALLAAYEDILTAAYPSGDGAHWGTMGPDLLGAALVAEVEEASDQQFIEQLLPHPHLSLEQRHQGLTVIARATPDQPALTAGAARAIAAAPKQLLPLAARTVAAELDPEVARPWLLGLRDAINEQAQQPGADPQTTAWAAGVVRASLTHLETGLEDYFNSVEAVPPPPEPGSARHHDDGLEEDADDPDEAEADWGTEDEEEPESEQSADPDDTAPLPLAPAPHHNRSRSPRTFHAHTITSPVARTALTTVALAHLALVAFVTGSTAYSSDDFTGPTSWLLPPTIVLFHLLIGLLYGHRKMPLSLMAVVLPPAIIVMTVLCAVSFSNMHGVHLNPVALGAAWASIFSPGLLALTYAVRAWLGQIQYVDTK
ncbi:MULTISPECIES: S1 family peptidase [Streptomyces]|uniref:Serine protease n=1 Tax=Streptomyces flavovirens TaxID=52258 RepID=A0ABV8NAN3_9ACTN|nr:serine protease [Streptomyces sp. MBT51]MBK3594332.1 trypsin-like peptidase domain-containing protein [Streptomyces sp. MBT51]